MVVSLVMLAAITLLGVLVMSNSRLEWLMTVNSRFQSDAAMRAEATLKYAEDLIAATIPDPAVYDWSTADSFYSDAPPLPNIYALSGDPGNDVSWINNAFVTDSASAGISAPSGTRNDYVIDYLGGYSEASPIISGGTDSCMGSDNISIDLYRVWARATDGKGSIRIAQSVFAMVTSVTGVRRYCRLAYAEILP